MPFRIERNDIVRMKTDAIVNTANPEPLCGSGTDRAIYTAAGMDELLAARREIGPIAAGDAAVTPGFSLPAKYIIHTVGPFWTGGTEGEVETLRSCVTRSLDLARDLGCESIAFPLLSTGNNGFPKDLALRTTLSAFSDWLMQDGNEMFITLTVFDRESADISGKVSARLFGPRDGGLEEYIDDHYVGERYDAEYPTHRRRRRGIYARKDDAAQNTAARREDAKAESSEILPDAEEGGSDARREDAVFGVQREDAFLGRPAEAEVSESQPDVSEETGGALSNASALSDNLPPEKPASGLPVAGGAEVQDESVPYHADFGMGGAAASAGFGKAGAAPSADFGKTGAAPSADFGKTGAAPSAGFEKAGAEPHHAYFGMAGDATKPAASAKKKPSLADRIRNIGDSFHTRLFRLIDERGMSHVQVYKAANLDKRLFSKILSNPKYKPKKETALALAIALRLNIDETADLLSRAGFALSPSNMTDVIVRYYIESGNYDMYKINCELFDHGEEPLGSWGDAGVNAG